ncbi:MAG: Ribonucleotide reductase of class III (anaerobic), large subunit [Candidatus Carbobacillus altaicus]|uniref:Ribonucleotide reductase of class III (Anaerobic), large subunit n=1 Tax=Candidatus Carbonibacillus altaicus TaxID=2163959 RepID=A0A2R6Y0Z7_9BACL|nr:MAG: Ribonucleotide reductase of class III (anaerobic), large subunit [Candidatus Carbobacillus altaicus]
MVHVVHTARSYTARFRTARLRTARLRTASMLGETAQRLIDDFLGEKDWRVRENSNMQYSLQGLNNYVAGELSAHYWLDQVYTPEIRDAHRRGDMHIHDLGSLSVYCMGWDLEDLLLTGFTGVPGKVTSRPARHFRTALLQIVNFFYTLQGEAAGAQAFSNFDTLLAPFIAYDGLVYEEVKQAMQEFIYNLNVPTRVGFQTPFTNLTLDLVVPETYRHERVIIGGERKDRTYGEFQREMDMLNMAFAEVMLEGDASGRIFTFPIPTYNVTPDFPWDSPVVQNVMEMTARYGIPYFSNFINSDMHPEDARSMCCRLRLDNRELRKRGGGLFGANPLTGSVGVVTINLPRIGYTATTEEDFLKTLGRLMDIAKESLELKRRAIERWAEEGLYPYTKFYLRHFAPKKAEPFSLSLQGPGTLGMSESDERGYFRNHFSTIGLIGMHEALMNFRGWRLSEARGQDFAVRVMAFMRERLLQYQEETGNLYNLEATPAEGASYRLAQLDKAYYPDIITAGSESVPYYTNSTQIPVGEMNDLFAQLQLEEPMQVMYTGGTVFHAFLGESLSDGRVAGKLVRTIMEKTRIPYVTLTPTFSICPEHGYLQGEQWTCPHCGRETEVYSRIVGYYRPIKQWNDGKKEEFKDRLTFALGGGGV